METRLQALEERVTRLSDRVDQLEQKLAGLPVTPFLPAWPGSEPQLAQPAAAEMARWVTLLGRSCMVLGGAFLIRALTDNRTVPRGAGVALGVLFAAAWVFLAQRAAARGATLSAGFHGVTASLIAYPLVVEATTRLDGMSSWVAALTLIGFTALLLIASSRGRLAWLAWIGVFFCLLTTLILLRATPARAEFTGVLLVLAGTSYWLGDRPPLGALRWVPALFLDLIILRAVVTSTPPLLLFSLALAGLSLAHVCRRTAALARPIGAFEVLQTPTGLVIGLAGALRASVEGGHGSGAVAGLALAAALLTLVFAAWVVPRRGNHDLDFVFYSGLSLGLLCFAVALLTASDLRGVLWSTFALVIALLGRRKHSGSLWSFAVLLAVGAGFTTGLIQGIWQALTGSGQSLRLAMSPGSAIVLGLLMLTYLATLLPPRPAAAFPVTSALPRVPAAVLLLLSSAGLAASILRAFSAFIPDLARLAAARTLAAMAVAVLLTLVRRRVAKPELKWIAYFALVLGGVELVFQGLPSGQPLLLVISFVLYGSGLILVPRLAPASRELSSSRRTR